MDVLTASTKITNETVHFISIFAAVFLFLKWNVLFLQKNLQVIIKKKKLVDHNLLLVGISKYGLGW